MIEIQIRDNSPEAFDHACKIFKKKVNDSGHLRELQQRRYFESPSQKRRRKNIERHRDKGRK
jgi:small subunit ribosomal protein S21